MTSYFKYFLLLVLTFGFANVAYADNDEAKVEAKADAKTDAKKDEKADAKADAPDAKTEEGDTAKKDAKVDEPKIESDDEAVEAAKTMYQAMRSGQWPLAVGLGIMLLIYLLARINILAKLPKKAVPWVATGTSILAYIAAALTAEGASMVEAISGGFMTGAAAVGLWEMVFKHFLGRSKAEA